MPNQQQDQIYNSWIWCNITVISWIINLVSKEIGESLLYIEDASEMWRNLFERFHQTNGPRIFEVKQTLNNFVWGSPDVTKLKMLLDELKDFRLAAVCTCGVMKSFTDFQQQEQILQFLMGLNESFSQIRVQILLIDPLPPINKAFSLVVQEERQRSINTGVISHSARNDASIPLAGVQLENSSNYRGKRER